MPTPLDFQSLCEIAERELNSGLADPQLVERSLAEAGGIEAHGRRIFWRRRAQQLQKLEAEAELQEILAALETQERRLIARKERHRWFWALVCFAAIIGTYVFTRLALAAFSRGGSIFYSVLSFACLVLIGIAYRAARYHTDTD